VWVKEREQILDGEVKLSLHILFLLAIQGSVHSFLIFHICMPIHTQSSVKCYHKQEGLVEAIVWHLRFILTIKSQVSPILGHHVDIWEGFF
jgi:hypothetical protein